jgi:hypothetical protein
MDKIKIWNTKYALTSGITTHMVVCQEGKDYVTIPKTTSSFSYSLFGEGKYWHKTQESAERRAEEMRVKKLASLNKQAKKIAALDFSKVKEL